jgi:hypothetical protein
MATGYGGLMQDARIVEIDEEWHLDPAHDDLVTSSSRILRDRDGKAIEDEQTRIVEQAQVKNGAWYPTHWIDTVTPEDGKKMSDEHRLEILPGEKLDPVWFTDPDKRWPKPLDTQKTP